jgi:hypothetical protein
MTNESDHVSAPNTEPQNTWGSNTTLVATGQMYFHYPAISLQDLRTSKKYLTWVSMEGYRDTIATTFCYLRGEFQSINFATKTPMSFELDIAMQINCRNYLVLYG